MEKFLKFISFLFLLLILQSCAEEQPENIESFDKTASFYIEFGIECGWCAGIEYIKITQSKVEYTRVIPCGDDKGTFINEQDLNEADWVELTSSFKLSEFMELAYNTCNLCADGCDEIIRIGDKDSSHEIRYTPGIEIEGMEALIEKLYLLIQEFHQN